MRLSAIFKALEEGKILQKMYHNDPECIKILKRETFTRSCDCCTPKEAVQYYFYGWGSYGLPKVHLMDVLENPDGWEIKE